MEPKFRSVGRSAQQEHPARTDFLRYHCDGCEAARPQEFYDAMRPLRELTATVRILRHDHTSPTRHENAPQRTTGPTTRHD